MKQKICASEMSELLNAFQNTILPWCLEHEFSLHQAFERSRQEAPEMHYVLCQLWKTEAGKEYLRTVFSEAHYLKGGKINV